MRRTAGLLAAAAVALAGCAAEGGGQDDRVGPGPSASASPSQSVRPTVGTTRTKPPSSPYVEDTLTGTAVRGVEPGCVGLKVKGKTYQLAGDEARELAKNGGEGQRLGKVRVKGHYAPKGTVSTCMMGNIFVVVELTRL